VFDLKITGGTVVDGTGAERYQADIAILDGKIVDVALKSFIIEVTGKESKINAMVELLSNYGILELVRTGEVAISRGKKVDEEEGSKVKVKAGKAGQSNL